MNGFACEWEAQPPPGQVLLSKLDEKKSRAGREREELKVTSTQRLCARCSLLAGSLVSRT